MHGDDIRNDACSECEELLELLNGFLDGELDDELRHELMLHAQSCNNCARLLYSLRRLVAHCRTEPSCDMPASVRQQLWLAIRREIHLEPGDQAEA